jgi:hypothetical protein
MTNEIIRSQGYAPDFDIDVKRGEVGEDLTAGILGEIDTVEVKTDYRASETGNVYIEVYSYRKSDKSDLKLSGISSSKANWWSFASPNGNGLVIIRTKDLRELVRENYTRYKVLQPIATEKTAASIGVALPMKLIIERIGLESQRD